jgi:NTE family protein
MNAIVMVAGFLEGGADGARHYLKQFWHKVSDAGAVFSPAQNMVADNPFSGFMPKWVTTENPAMQFFNAMAQNISPYQFNPLNMNPLRDILDDMIDFEAIRKDKNFKLFITATNVRTGASRIFISSELDCNMVMASAALPNVFQAVEIGGDAYWDGGYVGNPSLWPLYYETEGHDLLIVHVNPIIHKGIPKDALSIEDRVNEITFNSAMLKEMRAIAFVQKLLHENMLKEEYRKKYRDVLIHAIRADDVMRSFGMTTKFDTSWGVLTKLFDAGRECAKDWVEENFEKIGKMSSVDLEADYLNVSIDKKTKIA